MPSYRKRIRWSPSPSSSSLQLLKKVKVVLSCDFELYDAPLGNNNVAELSKLPYIVATQQSAFRLIAAANKSQTINCLSHPEGCVNPIAAEIYQQIANHSRKFDIIE